MFFSHPKSAAVAIVAASLCTAALAGGADSATVANQFIRAYFQDDNMAEAVKLASGAAKARLESELQQIKAVGSKEAAKDQPVVTTERVQMQPVSADEQLYVYRVVSQVAGVEPISAHLTLRKEGGTWKVSTFVQDE